MRDVSRVLPTNFREIGRGHVRILRCAIEDDPESRNDESGDACDQKHLAPAENQHQPCQQRGASAGASPDDELKMAIGKARWSSANQSVQTRVPPIYIGDSPRPNATRATMN